MEDLTTIGRAERVDFPQLGLKNIPAKIDTGADLSTIWASDITEQPGSLRFKLFAQDSPYYRDSEIEVRSPDYLLTRVASSFGHRQLRYVVKLQVKINGKLIKATFTLSDRSKKTYPVLIGRKLLNGKFLVDVSQGQPLADLEERKKKRMQKELEAFKMWEEKV